MICFINQNSFLQTNILIASDRCLTVLVCTDVHQAIGKPGKFRVKNDHCEIVPKETNDPNSDCLATPSLIVIYFILKCLHLQMFFDLSDSMLLSLWVHRLHPGCLLQRIFSCFSFRHEAAAQWEQRFCLWWERQWFEWVSQQISPTALAPEGTQTHNIYI